MQALGGCRPPGGGCAGSGRVQAARRGLCQPCGGTGRQEEAVPALVGYRDQEGSMPSLGGCRPPGGGCAGSGRVQAARRGLCRLWEGAGRQEWSVPALWGYRPPGGGCAGSGRVQGPGGVYAIPGRVQAARSGLCRPCGGTGRQEGSVPALWGCRPPGVISAGPGKLQVTRRVFLPALGGY